MTALVLGLLFIGSCLVAALTWFAWRRSGSISVLIVASVLYLWSLHGGWVFTLDEWMGDQSGSYRHLFGKLVELQVDQNYFMAIGIYTAFVCTVLLTAAVLMRKPIEWTPVPVSPLALLALGVGSLLLSYLVVREQLAAALIANQSGYSVTAGGSDAVPLFKWHQLALRFSFVPLVIGLVAVSRRGEGRLFTSDSGKVMSVSLAVGLIGATAFAALMGNKNEVLFAGLLGAQLYTLNAVRIPWRMLLIGSAVGMLGLGMIDLWRGASLVELAGHDVKLDVGTAINQVLRSNEFFAAHVSLYGVLDARPDLTYGSSLWSLVASFVPHALWEQRPEQIYEYYALIVSAPEGQGFTVHHAAAWYLNFGIIGVLIGGVVLGFVVGGMQRACARWRPGIHPVVTVALWCSFCGICAGMANFVRAGPEAYKPLIMYSVMFPVFSLACAVLARMIVSPTIRRAVDRRSPLEGDV